MVKKYTFYILYTLLIVSFFGFGLIRVPGMPLNFGQTMQLLMIAWCLFDGSVRYWDKYQALFWSFYLLFFFSSFITGYVDSFLNSIVRKVFGVVSIYWSTKLMITKKTPRSIMLVPILVIGGLDTIITICQCFNIPIFEPFLYMIDAYSENVEELQGMMLRRDITLGMSMCGMFGDAVNNGHFLLLMYCLSLSILNGKIFTFKLLIPLFILGGLFFCQQRAAFYLAIMITFLYVYLIAKNDIKSRRIIIGSFICISIFLLAFGLDFYLSSDTELGSNRLFNLEDEARERLNDNSIDFIFNNFFFGGHYKYSELYSLPPHNILFDAFISGGIIGGLILLTLILKQCLLVLQRIRQNVLSDSLVYGLAFLAMIGDSFFHNSGYIQADVLTFFSWALFFTSYKLEKMNYRYGKGTISVTT